MNYLAHLYLSGDDPQLQLGNFIADSVRGAQIKLYPDRVQDGIRLHRLIDQYTDAHPVVTQVKERLRPLFRKYAGVVVDVYFDHFLAANFSQYSHVSLAEFASAAYALVQDQWTLMPERVQHFFPYMLRDNWLVSYAQIRGIERALNGLSTRASFVSGMEQGGEELRRNYPLYQHDFEQFFPDLQAYVLELLEIKN